MTPDEHSEALELNRAWHQARAATAEELDQYVSFTSTTPVKSVKGKMMDQAAIMRIDGLIEDERKARDAYFSFLKRLQS